MIIAKNLSKQYKDTLAVSGVSFEVKEGENLALLGTSGCGKTTTLRMINRLVEPSSGNVYINGKSIFSQSAESLRRGIGYVLQNHGLFPHYTIAENIAIVPRLLHWDREKIERQTIALLDKLKLPPEKYLHVYPDQLSGGQQQRVGLARALAADPPILLMDEPFGALDPITRGQIRKEFNTMEELKKKTIILVTHDVQEAFELGDRICLMNQGKIMQIGTPAELLFRTANDFVDSFLSGQRLQLELKAVKLHDIWSYLTDVQDEGPAQTETISWNKSVWDAMEHWSGANGSQKALQVINEKTNEKKAIDAAALFTALNKFKQTF